jgi:hypothetical protein
MSKRITVPLRDSELIDAEAKRVWHGSYEKVATTTIKELVVKGVTLKSRYGFAHEYEAMQEMVLELPDHLAKEVESIHCDSKVGDLYDVVVRDWSTGLATEIGCRLGGAAIRHSCFHWHNGIIVRAANGEPFGDLKREIWIEEGC